MDIKISVIIAAYNEEKLLGRCLESLQNQSYPKNQYEIIVIDNGSSDDTFKIAKDYGTRVYTYTEIQGCGASRNFGVTKANGTIIAVSDADSLLPSDWLVKIDQSMQNDKIIAVGGPAVPDEKTVWIAGVFQFYDTFFILNHLFGKPILWGFNIAIRKFAYDKVGGIDHTLLGSDDWDLVMRLSKKFGPRRIRYIRDMKVITSTRKQADAKVFWQYAIDGVKNYYAVVILRKPRSVPVFNVR